MSDQPAEQPLSQDIAGANKVKIVVSSNIEKPNTKKVKLTYNDFRGEVEKPFNERREILTGRGGTKIKPRKYHLTSTEKAELEALRVSTGSAVVNPYGLRLGDYYAAVQALIDLGPNQWHGLKAVKERMKAIMQSMPEKSHKQDGKTIHVDAWSAFYDKISRNEAVKPKDGDGRIEQNFRVLQRVGKGDNNPCGLKLAQFGQSIDIKKKEVSPGIFLPFFRLNTTHVPDDTGFSIKPLYINPFTKRRGRPKGTKNKPRVPKIEEVKTEEIKTEVSVQDQIAILVEQDKEDTVIPDATHEDFE